MFRFRYNPTVTIMPMYGCPATEPEILDGEDAEKFLNAVNENNDKAISQDELEQLKKSYERLKDEKRQISRFGDTLRRRHNFV